MKRYTLTDTTELVLQRGDITRVSVDAIVNAANSSLLGGGGVDGAIHGAAGPELLKACRSLPLSHGVRCPTGEARITPGFELPASWVIHTVGPVYHREQNPAALLERSHAACMVLANERELSSIAFPAISCGVYGYPLRQAAEIAIATVRRHAGSLEAVHFVLYGQDTWSAWTRATRALLGPPFSEAKA